MKNICKMSFAAAFAVAFVSCMNFLGEDMRNSYKSSAKALEELQKKLLYDKVIDGKTFEKTSEVVIIPKGKTVTVVGSDDNWQNNYNNNGAYNYIGAFPKGRKAELEPFVLAQYEVTQELYEKVMGTNPSYFNSGAAEGENQKLRPVEQITWLDALEFCNKLSILEGLEPCYTIGGSTVTCDWTKKGYRMPTQAEWEFAARGGAPSKPEWNYTYPGKPAEEYLGDYAWYGDNSGSKTHQVGLKKPNSLGLYDICGNVWERCWDSCYVYWRTMTEEQIANVGPRGTNPNTSDTTTNDKSWRSGCWHSSFDECVVNRIGGAKDRSYSVGLRVARSL